MLAGIAAGFAAFFKWRADVNEKRAAAAEEALRYHKARSKNHQEINDSLRGTRERHQKEREELRKREREGKRERMGKW